MNPYPIIKYKKMTIQKFSYHTHTTFSDGSNSVEEMLEQAVNLGWNEIGISDHLQIHKYIDKVAEYHIYERIQKKTFKERESDLLKHIEHIRKAAKKYPLRVLIGLEVDYFSYNGWEEEFRSFIKGMDVDYLILGSHFCFDENDMIMDFGDASKPAHISNHFNNMQKGIESGLFKFVAHIDYIRKYQPMRMEDFKPEILGVLDALKKHNVATEFNSKGFSIGIGGPSPSNWVLEELRNRNIPIAISDDAHSVNMLGIHFEEAESLLQQLNYTNRWKFG